MTASYKPLLTPPQTNTPRQTDLYFRLRKDSFRRKLFCTAAPCRDDDEPLSLLAVR